MYKEYAYTKIRHLSWVVTLNGQTLLYVNVIQNAHLKHEPEFPAQFSLVRDNRLWQMIRYNIFTHFADTWSWIFTQMHGEKVGGINCFALSRRIQTLSKHYKRIFDKVETNLQW